LKSALFIGATQHFFSKSACREGYGCFQFPPAQREYSLTHSLALLHVADKAGGGKFMRPSLFCARAPANFLRVGGEEIYKKKVPECQKPLNPAHKSFIFNSRVAIT